ncbi:hypothetical protein MNBD_BACTEROID03-152 [hydrothermal vent metagenome]|uniref:Uncharacterized protein n=1 Tax=hydrothermal vent metagenome TaxID=652676 RepID=A0A3B0T723_9ZZZZ
MSLFRSYASLASILFITIIHNPINHLTRLVFVTAYGLKTNAAFEVLSYTDSTRARECVSLRIDQKQIVENIARTINDIITNTYST